MTVANVHAGPEPRPGSRPGTPRVILVNPRMCSPRSVRLPLSILALTAALEPDGDCVLIDGNMFEDATGQVLEAIGDHSPAVVGITVMPGPQVAPAIAVSRAVRARHPDVPIVWGGYFPTLHPDAAINAPYVDIVVRGQGEQTFREIVEAATGQTRGPLATSVLEGIPGITWNDDGRIRHNPDRAFVPPQTFPALPYHRLGNVKAYLRPSFLGTRTAVHQAAIGCRYRCTFCGVVSMFNGVTLPPGLESLAESLYILTHRYGANAIQFYDHNFFDRETTSVPVLETIARFNLPWWCYARADTLAGFSTETWRLLRRSRLTMAYIGAEAATDEVLRGMKKGSRVDDTILVAERCRTYGIIPEFSFVLGGPDDPDGEITRTFRFIRRLKRAHPRCEIILYVYSPTPQLDRAAARRHPTAARIPTLATYGPGGPPPPTTPEGWSTQPWLDYVCHRDAPWLTPHIRRRIRDFRTVLECRFPTVQDVDTPPWGRAILKGMASWRYALERYAAPAELRAARRLIPLRVPEAESL